MKLNTVYCVEALTNPYYRRYESQQSYEGVPHTVTWAQIQNQVARDGFATVMMHPQEFANHGPNGAFINELNNTMIQELRQLIQTVKASGMRTVVISRIREYFTLQNDPCATPVTSAPATSTSTSAQATTQAQLTSSSSASSTSSSSTNQGTSTSAQQSTTQGSTSSHVEAPGTGDGAAVVVNVWMMLLLFAFFLF